MTESFVGAGFINVAKPFKELVARASKYYRLNEG
jgi:hypothetical protein